MKYSLMKLIMKRQFVLIVLMFNSLLMLAQNVGIGTADPEAKLEIELQGSASYPQLLLHEVGNDFARLKFDNTNGSNDWTIKGYISSNTRNDILTFNNGDAGDLLTLKGNGRLGLGVGTSPKTDFHVAEDLRILFGKDTLGSGDKLMFLPDLHAFRVGNLAVGAASTYWNRDSIGLYSFASGRNTRAQGFGATAMGRDTEATNSYAFASGFFSNADGEYSTAMGHNSDAFGKGSTALGYSCDAEQDFTFAVGQFAEAQAESSMSIGHFTKAQSFRSTALGSYNVGGGNPSLWDDEDPIFEIGNGRTNSTRENALTVLKDGRHGIVTSQPKANLHVKDDGIIGQGTIVAVLESSLSDRPILQFSETSVGDAGSGMSIEYDGSGSGSDNKMNINNSSGAPIISFENGGQVIIGGQVGIGVASPTFALHLPNNTSTGIARAKSWSTYSDERIKSDEEVLSYGLREILLLKPLSYLQHEANFDSSVLEVNSEAESTIGFFAQEVHEIIPEAVVKPEDEDEQLWGMEYEKLIPVLVKAIQEQQSEIEALKVNVEKLTHDLQEAKISSNDQ